MDSPRPNPLSDLNLSLLRRFLLRHAIQLEVFVGGSEEPSCLPWNQEKCPLLSEMANALSIGCPFVPKNEVDVKADAIHIFRTAMTCSSSDAADMRNVVFRVAERVLMSWTEQSSTEYNSLLQSVNRLFTLDSGRELHSLVQTYESIDELPEPWYSLFEQVAAQLSEQLVKDFSGPSNMKKLKKIYSAIPFRTLGLLSRLTNPKSMVLGSISIALANPIGMQSLLQRVIRAAIPTKGITPSTRDARDELIRAMGDPRIKDSIRSVAASCMQPLEAVYQVVPIHEMMSKVKCGLGTLIASLDKEGVSVPEMVPVAKDALRQVWHILRRLSVSEEQDASSSIESTLRWMMRIFGTIADGEVTAAANEIVSQLFIQNTDRHRLELMEWISIQQVLELKQQEWKQRKDQLKVALGAAKKQGNHDHAVAISDEITFIRNLLHEGSLEAIVPTATQSPIVQKFQEGLAQLLRRRNCLFSDS
eukprot:TRINITY_DN1149_c0_g1_i1.p1 TRINITY_DN1149_c0_g1~~TRINITY_DN1149_c0_g1_i1.p1  ORF type:complete len:475 (-),score=41.75 TRINITY_DN1149_c0_g1_i1:1-1425(-)